MVGAVSSLRTSVRRAPVRRETNVAPDL
jgi:hypothetical protein